MKQNGFLYVVLLIIGFGIGMSVYRIFPMKTVNNPKITQYVPAAAVSATPFQTLTPSLTPTDIAVPPITPGERAIKVPILLYHYISENPYKDDKARNGLSTPPAILDQQLQFIASNGFTTISLDELAAAFDGKMTLPPKPIILTFDDGYVDFYFNAHPLLKKYNMKAIAFISTGLIGGGAYLTWGQIDELSHSPNVVIEAHSKHHYSLPSVSEKVLENEIIESKQTLEKHTGYTVNWMAYPYGSFNDNVIAEIKKAGYIGSAATLPGVWQYKSRFYHMPRYRAGTRLGNDLLKLVN